MLQSADFVLDPEFLALEFGYFGIGGSGMIHRLRQLGLEGLVLLEQLTKVRLKTHAILHSWLYDEQMMTQSWGLVEPLQRALVKNDVILIAEPKGRAMPKLDVIQEVQLRAQLQNLMQQHRDLDAAIISLEGTGTSDQLQLRRLKKMKLDIKDKIQRIETMLIPDIIA